MSATASVGLPRRAMGERTAQAAGWFVPAILAACLFLQRFGVPFGNLSINIVGPAGLVLVAAGFATGRLSLHRGRLCLFAGLLGFILLGSSVNGGTPDPFIGANIPSTLQFAAITFFATLTFARPMEERAFFRAVNRPLLIVAVAGIAQFIAQFAGIDLFSFDGVLPAAMLATSNWNQVIPLGIGSLVKSNGFFLVEPSVMSQFMALALMMEMLVLRRLGHLAVFGAGMILSFSGTGMIVLGVFILVVALRLGWRGLAVAAAMLVLACLAVGLVLLLAPDIAASVGSRADEINTPGSSGHMRFITPFWLLADMLHRVPDLAVFGLGGGVSERLVMPYDYDVNTPVKIGLEFGFPGLACYLLLFLVGKRSVLQSVLVLPCFVLLMFTGGYQQFAPVVYLVALISCVARLEPEQAGHGLPGDHGWTGTSPR